MEPTAAVRMLESSSKDELIRIILDDARNWLAHDGLWFQAVEGAHGMEAAIDADRAAWVHFTVIEAKRIMDRLGLRPGGGIPALLACLQHRLYARLNPQEAIEVSDRRAVFVMRDCRVRFPLPACRPRRVRGVRADHRPPHPHAMHFLPARSARTRRRLRLGVHHRRRLEVMPDASRQGGDGRAGPHVSAPSLEKKAVSSQFAPGLLTCTERPSGFRL